MFQKAKGALTFGVATAVVWLATPVGVWASSSGGSGLPWETPLQTIANSIKGPVAFVISLLGVVVTGAVLLFGGEIGDFVRRLIMLVLVISLIVCAGSILSNLFGIGAVLPAALP